MDHLVIRRSNSIVDLEIGGSSSEDNVVKGLGSSGEKAKRLDRLRSESPSTIGMTRGGDGSSSSEDTLSYIENLEMLVCEKGEMAKISAENGLVKEKRKKRSAKPPLPPKGPSLHGAADMKLLREMSELTRLKHARVKRMKALKKKRTEKGSCSSSNIFSIVVTIVFFYVIIFQGFLGSRA
ncbi:hypothetical protein P3X46_008605 [Hevea brasiliensis]|uniref:Uncharacterized protein n=1 Tax=Hevea brasiliensis TaxID=3981 RepID=A0ABQ9MJ50_HEVBR|nr:uncharacterized protein LOC110644478 [Hevea brasiliensis]KAJ9180347.1 hypothetical protein P3X46_008605 [Hevea brasiliensis]